jgi:prophage antirepressor-like protein
MLPQTFVFQGQYSIRFIGTIDKPEWFASDILPLLYDVKDRRNEAIAPLMAKVPKEWQSLRVVQTTSGEQSVYTLLEGGLYYVIGCSKSPLALPLWKWVFEEILSPMREEQEGHAPLVCPEEIQRRLDVVKNIIHLAQENRSDQDEELRLTIRNILRESLHQIHHSFIDPRSHAAFKTLQRQSQRPDGLDRRTDNGGRSGQPLSLTD